MKRFRFNILFLSLLVIASCGDNLGKNERKALEMSEVKCIEQGSNHLVFAWEAVKAASHYEITIDGGKTVSSYDTEYRLNGLAPESEHSLAVRAISSSIEWYDSEERGCTARTLPYTDGGNGGDGGDGGNSGDGGNGGGGGDGGDGGSTSPSTWFELPKIEDSDKNGIWDSDNSLHLAFHYCAGGEKGPDGKTARNYSVCYSGEHHCPVWVAAPRHSMYVGSADRTNAYGQDPDIASEIQYNSKATGGGCNKGHMLGSAERTSSTETNRQVFYYTNIAPQLSTGFNTGGGGWNLLEDYIDTQVVKDTLYEVVGCYFKTFTDGYGNTVNPKTISFGGRNDVSMPTMFYYAVLRTKKGNSGKSVKDCKADELQCVAFVRAHTNSLKGQEPSSKEMMSIADLERLTGFSYFAGVPNAPKDSFKASDWGL